MANNQDANGNFRPFVSGMFEPNSYIQAGAQASTPYRRAVNDLAYNANTIMARAKHNIINQVEWENGTTSIAGPGPVSWAKYISFVPNVPGRTNLTIVVNAVTTGGTTYQVRGVTSSGTGSYSSASGVGGGTVTATVPIAGLDFQVVSLEFLLSGAGNFQPKWAFGHYADITSTAIGTDVNANYVPQDSTVQYTTDWPLSVAMMSELALINKSMYNHNMRCIANWSYWGDWSTVVSSNVGISQAYSATSTTVGVMTNQFYYVARPGVRNLKIFAAGRTQGYAGTAGNSIFSFDGTTQVETPFGTATTVITEDNWAAWAQTLPVPQVAEPQLLTLYLKTPGAATTTNLQAFAIYEDYATVVV